MTTEEHRLAEEQQRAIQTRAPTTGALITPSYLERQQEVVAVNRSDLENIRDFDKTSTAFGGIGTFLFGGGLWLGVDKFSDWAEGPLPLIVMFCAFVCALGLVFIFVGWFFAKRKTAFIDRIFRETKPISAPRTA